MSSSSNIENLISFELFIEYDYLPIKQYSNILISIDELYSNLIYLYDSPMLVPLPNYKYLFPFIPTLCVDNIYTGNSIFNRISFDRKILPEIIWNNEAGGLEIHLPRWSAILAIAIYLLNHGMDIYKKKLEIENIELNNEKTRIELRQMDLNKLKDQKNPIVNNIMINLNSFHREINNYNIRVVRLNNQEIKNRNISK